jgi:hypothetical protein
MVMAEVPPGGLVTMPVIDDPLIKPTAFAYADPPPGAAMRFIRPTHIADTNPPKNFLLSYDSYSGAQGKVYYFAPCRSADMGYATTGATGSATLMGYQGCPGEITFDYGAAAYDANGNLLGAGLNIQGSFNGPTSLPPIDISSTSSFAVNADVDVVPPGTLYYTIDAIAYRGGHPLLTRSGIISDPSGSASLAVSFPAGIFDRVDTLQEIALGLYSFRERLDRAQVFPVDVPWAADSPAFDTDAGPPDLATRTVPYALEAGPPGDIVLLNIYQNDGTDGVWLVVAPPDTTPAAVTLPKLGSPYEGFDIADNATTNMWISDVDFDFLDGFAAALAAGVYTKDGVTFDAPASTTRHRSASLSP